MKKIVSIVALTLSLNTVAFTQEGSKLSGLLDNYINIKNALTTDDATKASTNATDYLKMLNAIDVKTLSVTEQKAFNPLKDKLSSDAKLIAEAKDINKQREAFVGFSNNMISLAKTAKLSTGDVFVEYCPMKKASWLSTEKAIKNPYYGSEMLDCGSVKETIKQ
jgi:hypothetical protein